MSLEVSLKDLRLFYGELQDGKDSQEKFRHFIKQEKWRLEDLEVWLSESIKSEWDKEFQDLIIALGGRLGFDIEFGCYRTISGRIPFDGLWKTGDGKLIIVEVKMGTWVTIDVSQVGQYLDRIAREHGISKTEVYGLYVVGDAGGIKSLSDQVRGSEYAHVVRIITYSDLLRLAKIREQEGLTDHQVARLLLPIDAVNVGELVQLIDSLLKAREIAAETPTRRPPELREEDLPILTSEEIAKLPDGETILCPSRPEGTRFLRTYNAWGFVRLTREPKYLALYVSAPESSVKYLAEVDRIIDPKSPESPVIRPEDYETYEEGKKLILFKLGSLRRLAEPIKPGSAIPYGLRYYRLKDLAKAKTLDDLK